MGRQNAKIAKFRDLAVIGAGVNGVQTALDAAGRGLSVLLCEKDGLSYFFDELVGDHYVFDVDRQRGISRRHGKRVRAIIDRRASRKPTDLGWYFGAEVDWMTAEEWLREPEYPLAMDQMRSLDR